VFVIDIAALDSIQLQVTAEVSVVQSYLALTTIYALMQLAELVFSISWLPRYVHLRVMPDATDCKLQ
jgi:hypothetical protein